MITSDNLKKVLEKLGFSHKNEEYSDQYGLKIDFIKKKIIYHKDIKINDETTSNFSKNENFVVFECVHRLLQKGYEPSCIELEPKWTLGRETKGGKADILIKDKGGKPYLLIECKTTDSRNSEFRKEWQRMQNNGGQLLSYYRQDKNIKFLCLYTSDFIDKDIVYENYILNMQDNHIYLEENHFTESYANAQNEEEIFRVWNEIYKGEYSSIGIFEKSINAYEIGKNALCFEDLKELNLQDDSKYHEFAKILRKYNISGKENAFDKLVNLFLCKIYDETHNKDNLDFVYRGVMADTFEDLQDRLMRLYARAMKEFLKEDITYIENDNVDKAFALMNKSKKSVSDLQEQINDFIRQLKFYSNNDFAFLEVHNKELFQKNALVLVSVVKLFENLRLTENKAQQFLGNLFELFLQKGMKQDEGQFFTPIQICEFIIYSLPLERTKPLRVIDYACGAGHFLNVYANFIKQNSIGDPKEHYKYIYGIEKEYRLSKVAKVSASMYGQSEINILYADALETNKNIKNLSFDLLIANPPYAVKGFLETLSKKALKSYELYDEKIKIENNNDIECFFIERANQLLDDNANAAIILPSTFLNKDGIYQKTREMLFKSFKIVAIVELGSNTFGATNTSTIILFLKKLPMYEKDRQKSHRISSLKFSILTNRLDANFLQDDEHFIDNGYIDSYLIFRKIQRSVFEKLIKGEFDDEYKKVFQDYINQWKKQKNKKVTISKEEEKNQIVNFIQMKEKEKLLYFSMLKDDEVLIVKSPEKNDEQKTFLGYEWSNRKGSEGLKELSIPYLSPLYERENKNNKNKIAYLIKQAFLGLKYEINEGLRDYAFKTKLLDMMNYDDVDFNKTINLNVSLKKKSFLNKNIKYEWIKLGEIEKIQIKKGTPITKKQTSNGQVKVVAGGRDYAYFHNQANRPKNTITISASGANAGYVNFWSEEIFASDCTTINLEPRETLKYIFFTLKYMQNDIANLARGSANQHVYPKDIENFKIPFPPFEKQQEIVKKCEDFGKEIEKTKTEINQILVLQTEVLIKCNIIEKHNKLNITDIIEKINQLNIYIDKEIFLKIKEKQKEYRLSDQCFKLAIGKRVLDNELVLNGKIPVYSANVTEIFGFLNKELLEDYNQDSVLWGIDGDWMVGYIKKNIPFYPTDHCGVLRVDEDLIDAKYISFVLREVGKTMRFSRNNRASIERIKSLKFTLPPLECQKQIARMMEKLETRIETLKRQIEEINNQKRKTLENFYIDQKRI